MIFRTKGMFDIRNVYSGLKKLILRHKIASRLILQILALIMCMETYQVIGGKIFLGEWLPMIFGLLVVYPTYFMICEVLDYKLFGRIPSKGIYEKIILSNIFLIGILGIVLLQPSLNALSRLLLHVLINATIVVYLHYKGRN